MPRAVSAIVERMAFGGTLQRDSPDGRANDCAESFQGGVAYRSCHAVTGVLQMFAIGLLTRCLSLGRGSAPRRLSYYLSACTLCWIVAPGSYADDTVEEYLGALRVGLDARVIETLAAIEGTGRQLLAVRSYVRSAAQLEERWSWTDAQIAAYAGSPEKLRLDAAIARVRCTFESANPGLTLFVSGEIRSLDRQIDKWNRNESVKRAADHMLETFRVELATPAFPRANSPEGTSAFRKLLLSFKPVPTPTLAAPGLSPHGRMQAIDFQVMAGNRIVAGTGSSSVIEAWETPGWKAKLQSAVNEANAGFVGPLKNPNEPWHYDFRPGATVELTPLPSNCAGAANSATFPADINFDTYLSLAALGGRLEGESSLCSLHDGILAIGGEFIDVGLEARQNFVVIRDAQTWTELWSLAFAGPPNRLGRLPARGRWRGRLGLSLCRRSGNKTGDQQHARSFHECLQQRRPKAKILFVAQANATHPERIKRPRPKPLPLGEADQRVATEDAT